jgi:muramoyltetrapeptide carboxypeptidase
MLQLQIPPQIKKGDTAFVVSPSAGLIPFVQHRSERATQHLSELGLHVIYADHAKKNSGYVSASIEERAADIHQAFSDPNCSLVIASIGGNHSNQLLDVLDYDLIARNPKVFIGYSDMTVLHYAFATQARLQTYYGPCFLTQFGEFPQVQPYTKESFEKIIFGDQREHTSNRVIPIPMRFWIGSKMKIHRELESLLPTPVMTGGVPDQPEAGHFRPPYLQLIISSALSTCPKPREQSCSWTFLKELQFMRAWHFLNSMLA